MSGETAPATSPAVFPGPQSPNHDRTHFVPRHVNNETLPNSPLFSRLLRYAHGKPARTVIKDVNLDVEKTHIQLLTDVLALRKTVEASLSSTTRTVLENRGDVYIGVLAPGGYEFAVAVLVVLAMGAVVVPLSTALPLKEAAYFVLKSRQSALLASASATVLGQALVDFVNLKANMSMSCISIAPSLQVFPLLPERVAISSDQYLDDNATGVVIFTSGTTGPPKGAAMRRAFIHDSALAVADHYELTRNDTILHVLPVHHSTGMGNTFFPFLISGSCIEFRSGSFDSAWLWERWRQGGLTFFSGVPTMYMRMMRFYEQDLAKLPVDILEQYIAGARQFRGMLCGTCALPRSMQQFWTTIRGGKILLTRYGATEFGGVFKVSLNPENTPDGSVGRVVPGVDVKLSNGEEGELLVKSPFMFSRYIFDDEATAKAHDAEGYFKTGDIARREGSYYFIVGRASLDIIKSGGYKISALDIERECLDLPYVSEAMVVGVADEEFGQRVAAAISLRKSHNEFSSGVEAGDGTITLDHLRRDLRRRLAEYKMPTLLRVVDGELPKTASGKVLKRVLGPKLFPPHWSCIHDVQAWHNKRSGISMKL